MDVKLANLSSPAADYVSNQSTTNSVPDSDGGKSSGVQATKPQDAARSDSNSVTQTKATEPKKELTRDETDLLTETLNKFMDSMNAKLQFVVHDKTHRLMVQVVDPETNKVLKEFPPHELLDTMAAISDYVGTLLDKKV